MASLKYGRRQICWDCSLWANSPHWTWPKCIAGVPSRELNDNAFDGPETDCPEGRWTDIDLEALVPKNLRAMLDQQDELFATRNAECEMCEGLLRGERVCPLKACNPRCRMIRLRRPRMACPKDLPIWGPVAAAKEAAP